MKRTRRNNSEVISRNGRKQRVLLEYANLAAGILDMRDEARGLTVREPTEGPRESIRQISIEVFFVSIAEWGQNNGI